VSALHGKLRLSISAKVVALALIGAPTLAGAALSDDGQAAPQTSSTACFLRREWTGSWKVTPDSRTIYIKVAGSIYKLDLTQAYPLLQSPWAVLHNTDASDSICSAIDFRLSVSDRIGNWQTPIVKKMTRLSAAQAAELPKHLRP
jgi:hypothetical protein